MVGDLAQALAPFYDVRVLAARDDTEGIEWHGRTDRVAPWPARTWGPRQVSVSYYGLSTGWALALAPVVYLPGWGRPRIYKAFSDLLDRSYPALGGAALARAHRGRDLVHRFGGSKLAGATVRAAHRAGVPVVISPYAHRGQWDDDPISARAYREADLVVAASPDDRRLYLDLGVPPGKVVVGPHLVDVARTGGGPALRRDRGIAGRTVLFIGSDQAYKGAHLVLEMAAALEHDLPDVTWVFIGPTSVRPAGLGNVVVGGHVSEEEKWAWLDGASLLVLPSAKESYGLVIDEAWAAGVPVLTSDIAELANRVAAAGAGLAVPRRRDALVGAARRLLSDEDLRARMGEAGRRHWEAHLTPQAYTSWWRGTYEALAAGPRPARRWA